MSSNERILNFTKIMTKMYCVLGLLSISFTVWAAPESIVKYPKHLCHAVSYNDPLFESIDGLPANYLPFEKIKKHTILCVGTHLEIDEPIFTNGGNLVIFADSVVVRAKIDTRVYFDYTEFSPYMSGVDTNRIYGLNRAQPPLALNNSKHFKNFGGRVHDPRVPKLYDAYYSRRSQCVQHSSRVFRPHMLSGLSPSAIPQNLAGYAFPSEKVNWESVRSGNVQIFAGDLTLDASLVAESGGCDLDKVTSENLIITDGIAGADGGAGTPVCTGHSTARFDCADRLYVRKGSVNSPGRKGADAGNIQVLLTGRYTGGSLISLLGGDPGLNKKLEVPAGRGRYEIRTGAFEDFFPASPDWPLSDSGNDGSLDVAEQVSSSELLIELSMAIKEADLSNDYDVVELAERAKLDIDITSISFEDYFQKFLSETLSQVQAGFTNELLESTLSQGPNSTSLLPGVLTGLDKSRLSETLLFSESFRLLSELLYFEKIEGQPTINSYFLQTGGILNIYDESAYETLLSRSAIAGINDIGAVLNTVRADLNQLERLVNDVYITVERNRFDRLLSELQSALAAAEAAAEDDADILPKLKRIGKAIGSLVSGINSGNYLQAAQGGYELVSSIQDLSQTSVDDLPDILRERIAELRNRYKVFLYAAAEVRDGTISDYAFSLEQALKSRSQIDSARTFASARFHDVLRSTLVSHLLDRSGNVNFLQNNLIALRELLLGFPDVGPGLRIKTFSFRCDSRIFRSNCKTIVSSKKPSYWEIESKTDVLNSVPWVVLEPGRRERVPVFGFGLKKTELDAIEIGEGESTIQSIYILGSQ